MREFGLCTLPSSEPRTCARTETWSGTALPKALTRPNLLKCYVFQHFYRHTWAGTRFFTKSLKRRAPTAVARLVFAEMIASEAPEQLLSTNVEKSCFFALKRDEINQNSVRHESPYKCGSEAPPATPKIIVLHSL